MAAAVNAPFIERAVASTIAREGGMPAGASSESSAPDKGLADSLRFYAP